jgi:pSer/pThr/pTyr-binding forkhead associated (FHA) protein
LEFVGPRSAHRLEKIVDRFPFRIGRGEGADLRIDDVKASRMHASIERQGGGIVLRDLGSSNGLHTADGRVSELVLSAGTEFRLGQHSFRVVESDFDRGEELAAARGPRAEPVVAAPSPQPFLRMLPRARNSAVTDIRQLTANLPPPSEKTFVAWLAAAAAAGALFVLSNQALATTVLIIVLGSAVLALVALVASFVRKMRGRNYDYAVFFSRLLACGLASTALDFLQSILHDRYADALPPGAVVRGLQVGVGVFGLVDLVVRAGALEGRARSVVRGIFYFPAVLSVAVTVGLSFKAEPSWEPQQVLRPFSSKLSFWDSQAEADQAAFDCRLWLSAAAAGGNSVQVPSDCNAR